MKTRHEVRDAVHGFITFDNDEKRIIDSRPVQRLRSIQQLALTSYVYPGATHARFEHSLGVMEVATRIFDVVFRLQPNDAIQNCLSEDLSPQKLEYWRSVTRYAALLHDIGHLPFSHAAEAALLPNGWNHERLTADMIRQSEIADLLADKAAPVHVADVIDVAWDVRKRVAYEPDTDVSPWKTLLNQLITGNTFGADRIDYLLRDSHHAGVSYGRFDADRLVNSLRVVIDESEQVAFGLDIGGIHSAEALLLARYFMYTQVYLHDVRRVYDIHLMDFLQAWLSGGCFSTEWRDLIAMTDDEVMVAMRLAAADARHPLHTLAERVLSRHHFRTVYTCPATYRIKHRELFAHLRSRATEEFGIENLRFDEYTPGAEVNQFPVVAENGNILRSIEESGVLANIPDIQLGLIFAHQSIEEEARTAIDQWERDETNA